MKRKLCDSLSQSGLRKNFLIFRISALLILVNLLPQVPAGGFSHETNFYMNTNHNDVITVQQVRAISGTIKDVAGEPLLAVTVLVKGTATGTNSDIEGKFKLEIPAKAQVLVFSFVGMKTLEVPIGDRIVFDIVMEEDIANLDEVVVVGYGTMKRRDVIGASSAVRGADIVKAPVSSAAEALTGRMAGVQLSTTEGQPGADIIIKIRGVHPFLRTIHLSI